MLSKDIAHVSVPGSIIRTSDSHPIHDGIKNYSYNLKMGIFINLSII